MCFTAKIVKYLIFHNFSNFTNFQSYYLISINKVTTILTVICVCFLNDQMCSTVPIEQNVLNFPSIIEGTGRYPIYDDT